MSRRVGPALVRAELRVVVVVIRVEAFQFKFFGVSYSAIHSGVAVGMSVDMRRFVIGFVILFPSVHGIQVDQYVYDCTMLVAESM